MSHVVLFALEREAAPFRKSAAVRRGVHVLVMGIGPARARAAAEQIAAISPQLVVSTGFAGALQAQWKVGDVIIAKEVVDIEGQIWPCHRVGASSGRLLTSGRLAATTHDKLELGSRFQADAVDMESAAVAAVCARRGIPFLAVRVISDAVETELSPQLVRLLSDGRVSIWRAIRALARTPRLLGEFRRLARDTRLASRLLAVALEKVMTEIKPDFNPNKP